MFLIVSYVDLLMYKTSALKRLILSILAWVVVFGLNAGAIAHAASWPTVSWSTMRLSPVYLADASTPSGQEWMAQLEKEILPQIEQIFNPEQREQFRANMAEGTSFRKAFKSLMLTPEQKMQIKTVLKSVSKKDALASLTPDQKKQLFLKKKEMFMPTAEEITERIETSFKDKGLELPAEVKEKIDAGLKMKDNFIPSAEAITEKIEAGMSALKEQLED